MDRWFSRWTLNNVRSHSLQTPSPTSHFPVQRTAAQQSTTVTIPSPNPPRRPANIPLRTLSSTSRNSHSERLLGAQSDEKQGRRSSLSRSSSPSSEFSWSDTGDLAEQIADAEDPLRIKLRASLDEEVFGNTARRASTRHTKRVRYDDSVDVEPKEHQAGIVKEDIPIPNPGPRYITRVEHIIAAAMSGGERQMQGLTGRPLV